MFFALFLTDVYLSCFSSTVPSELSYDQITKAFIDPRKRPELSNASFEFIAPSEYMVSDKILKISIFYFLKAEFSYNYFLPFGSRARDKDTRCVFIYIMIYYKSQDFVLYLTFLN